MEGKNEKRLIENTVNLSDTLQSFGRFLSKALSTSGKNLKQIAIELEVNTPLVSKWQTSGGYYLPSEEMLPAIAKAYGVDLKELTNVLKISKEAREEEKKLKKGLKSKPRNFSASISAPEPLHQRRKSSRTPTWRDDDSN